MKTLKYKGYVGSIDYSEDDGVLFGEILGIDGLVSYEGKTVEELTQSFHEAVEDYLVFCEEHNRKPQKHGRRGRHHNQCFCKACALRSCEASERNTGISCAGIRGGSDKAADAQGA